MGGGEGGGYSVPSGTTLVEVLPFSTQGCPGFLGTEVSSRQRGKEPEALSWEVLHGPGTGTYLLLARN